ncbi:hypothetical protein, partial [Novacetimonas hansenii]|uniref:hypothetical protein n=1 Tax=Novacetimonas hansenii TaxID=436 RepID=UPI001C37C036
ELSAPEAVNGDIGPTTNNVNPLIESFLKKLDPHETKPRFSANMHGHLFCRHGCQPQRHPKIMI